MENKNGFIKLNRSTQIEEMILQYQPAFILLTIISLRATREENKILGLCPGECFLGDFKKYGMSEWQYRTAKAKLEEWGFCHFKPTSKGTVALLLTNAVYDINLTNETTDRPRTDHGQTTTNKKERSEEREEHLSDKSEEKDLGLKQKELKPDIKSDIEKTLECWNDFSESEYKFMKCRGITKHIQVEYKKIRQDYTHEQMIQGIVNYANEIAGRKKGHDYFNHRFSLYDFISKKNGAIKFINQ